MRCLPLLVLSFAACRAAPVEAPAAAAQDDVRTPAGRVVASLQRVPHDPARHLDTCKVYHHVFAPDGRLLTKGLGGEFEHHRGLFVGWNQMRWRDGGYDFWHCRNGVTQQFRGFLPGADAGAGAWQTAAIEWCVGDGTPVVAEQRRLRARELAPDATVLDVQSELVALAGDVVLDGDPQHAGQQFRALQRFAEPGGPPVRYVRPAGATGGNDDLWADCAWIAAVLPMAGGDVTVLRIEGAGNPAPTKWSTRPYGRFGATFSTVLQPQRPLVLTWTYVLALGARDAAWCERTAGAVTAAGS